MCLVFCLSDVMQRHKRFAIMKAKFDGITIGARKEAQGNCCPIGALAGYTVGKEVMRLRQVSGPPALARHLPGRRGSPSPWSFLLEAEGVDGLEQLVGSAFRRGHQQLGGGRCESRT